MFSKSVNILSLWSFPNRICSRGSLPATLFIFLLLRLSQHALCCNVAYLKQIPTNTHSSYPSSYKRSITCSNPTLAISWGVRQIQALNSRFPTVPGEMSSGTLGSMAVCWVRGRVWKDRKITSLGTTREAFQNMRCLIKTQRMSKLRPDGKKEGGVQIKGHKRAWHVRGHESQGRDQHELRKADPE